VLEKPVSVRQDLTKRGLICPAKTLERSGIELVIAFHVIIIAMELTTKSIAEEKKKA
jgi:hypothetical protein